MGHFFGFPYMGQMLVAPPAQCWEVTPSEPPRLLSSFLSACCRCPALHPAEAEGAEPVAERQRPGGTVPGLIWDDLTGQLSGMGLRRELLRAERICLAP